MMAVAYESSIENDIKNASSIYELRKLRKV